MTTQDYEDYLIDAYHTVLPWDLPESEFADAVNEQARLMAGEPWELYPELPCPEAPLQF